MYCIPSAYIQQYTVTWTKESRLILKLCLSLIKKILLMMDFFAPLSLFLILTDLNLQRGDKRQSAGFLKSIGLHQLSSNWIIFFICHNLGLLIALHPGSGRRASQAITRGPHWTVDIGQSWRSPGHCYSSNQITVHLVWDESQTLGRMGLLREEEWTEIRWRERWEIETNLLKQIMCINRCMDECAIVTDRMVMLVMAF